MTATLFFNPITTLLSDAGAIVPNGTATFYLTLTTTPANVYSNANLSTSIGSVIQSDSDGRLPTIYMDASITYRVQIHDDNAVLIRDIDPYYPPRDYLPGTVILFYGTSGQRDAAYPPSLWAVLDGNNGTPNGLERYIRIAGGGTAIGSTGGASTDTTTTGNESAHTHAGGTIGGTALTTAQLPPHTHSVQYGFSDIAGSVSGGAGQTFGTANTINTQSTGSGDTHTHTGGTTGAGSAHSHSVTVDTLSPYVALFALMRKYP